MAPPRDNEVRTCHQTYCTHIQWQMPLTFHARELWERWLCAGFTEADLRLVLRRWQWKIARGTDAGVLRLSRLLDPDVFGEDLAIAHSEQKRVPTPKEKALEQLRPTVSELTPQQVKNGREAAAKALSDLAKKLEQS